MGGYDFSLRLIEKIRKKTDKANVNCQYSVTVLIVAHNEEKVIEKKLENVITNNYPKEKIKYIVASDNSSDQTNRIVNNFIETHPNFDMRLYITKEHKGKTNAQNEAQKYVDTDILVMTDANSMFRKNSISELVTSFVSDDIAYVCGALQYMNDENLTAESETTYWNQELKTRSIESNIKTITAGNGAIYACRNKDYIEIPPIECHDSSMPYYYGMHGKRALYNDKAIAYEKAGETVEDEYKRKVRMNRTILSHIGNGIKALNIFKFGWFSYFYFGHRTVRYLLWLNHLIVFVCSALLAILTGKIFWLSIVAMQVIIYALGYVGKFSKNKYIHLIYYYCITIVAQWHGVFNILTDKAKPTWDKAESTR